MTLWIDVVAATHRGRVRERNEDAAGVGGWSLTAADPRVVTLVLDVEVPVELVVADGLGGHVGGDVASRTAVGAFFAAVGDLGARITAADDALHAVSESDPRMVGLATTLAGAQVHPDGKLVAFNVGDSRVYRLVDGLLGMLTEDDKHDDGRLTQVLGGERRMAIEPHMFETSLSDDIVLICSDGLTSVLDEDVIAEALSHPLRQAASELLNRTLASGAPDNVTLILCAARRQGSATGSGTNLNTELRARQ